MIIGENTGADMPAQGVATNGAPRGIRAANPLMQARYRKEPGIAYLTGIQAIARLPLDQRRLDDRADLDTAGFISGYRGSPLGGLDQELWRLSDELKAHRVVFQPGVNEDLAATAVWGSQQVGLFPGARREGVYGLWYGKAPGLDRSSDAVRHANAAGTSPRGGVLLVVGDDHACKSSTLPSASEFALRDLGIPVLAPADVRDVLDFGLAGWAMSRYAGCWTGLIALTDIMDSALTVDIDLNRHRFVSPPHEEPFPHIRLQDSPADQEARLETKMHLARRFASANALDRIVTTIRSPRLVLVTAGKTYADVREALARLGLQSEAQLVRAGVRLVKLGMTWPLDTALVDDFCQGARRVMVIEEKRPFIEDQLRAILFGRRVELIGKANGGQPANPDDAGVGVSGFRRTNVFGRTLRPARPVAGSTGGTRLLPAAGQLDVADIARAIADALPAVTDHGYLGEVAAAARTLPGNAKYSKHVRKPMYCAGCPHNTSTRVPEGSRAAAGIGCHYMAQWMDRNTGTATHMGAEGVNWIGQAPFTDEPHIFANIGDGTYFHSGILAIRAAVAAGVNITYKVLANDAVAMTGGQPVDGSLTVEDIVAQVRAEGVAAVRVVSDKPKQYRKAGFHVATRDALDAVQRELKATPGCTVLVYEQTCAAELRRRRRRGLAADPDIRVVINDAVCEGCGDCSTQSSCVAVEPLDTEFGVKRTINQTACNKDLSCMDGFCPALVTVAGAKPRTTAEPNGAEPLVPLPPGSRNAANILIAGVGGTGIVTVSQVIGTAAHLDGSQVSTLDMTGLAQKGGAVVSHVRISPAGAQPHPPTRIPTACADVLIAADVVTAAGTDVLSLASANRTGVILNTHLVPTAEFVLRQRQGFEFDQLQSRVQGQAKRLATVDANAATETLFGSSAYANIFLLGYAFQMGGIPVSMESLQRAITLNGVAVEQNLLALRHGRAAAHEIETSPAELATRRPTRNHAMQPRRSSNLDDRIARRRAFLTEYQDAALSRRYEKLVKRIHDLETRVKPGSHALTEAVADSYFKLLSAKDEYEVARLFTRPSTAGDRDFASRLARQFEPGFRTTFYFAPPILARKRANGRPGKIAVGGWIMPFLRPLAKMRRCRGTVFDPFRYSGERRLDRTLLNRFEADIETITTRLDSANFEAALAMARLPTAIRGFGPVKQAAAESALKRRNLYLAQLLTPPGLAQPHPCSREGSREAAA